MRADINFGHVHEHGLGETKRRQPVVFEDLIEYLAGDLLVLLGEEDDARAERAPKPLNLLRGRSESVRAR